MSAPIRPRPPETSRAIAPAPELDPEDEFRDEESVSEFPEFIDDPEGPDDSDEPDESAVIAGNAYPVKRGPGRPRHFTEKEIASALRKAGGFNSVAARHLGCSHDTISRAVDRWPGLKKVQRECRAKQIDKAEGALQSAIAEGNIPAIIFFLKCQAKGRGFVERVETTGADGAPLVPPGLVIVDAGSIISGLRSGVASMLEAPDPLELPESPEVLALDPEE